MGALSRAHRRQGQKGTAVLRTSKAQERDSGRGEGGDAMNCDKSSEQERSTPLEQAPWPLSTGQPFKKKSP